MESLKFTCIAFFALLITIHKKKFAFYSKNIKDLHVPKYLHVDVEINKQSRNMFCDLDTKGWQDPCSPPVGDLTPIFSESLLSPNYESARLRKKLVGLGGLRPLKSEKKAKNLIFPL